MHALQRMHRAGNARARAIQTMTRTLRERGGTWPTIPSEDGPDELPNETSGNAARASSLGPAGVGMSVFSEVEIGFLHSKTMGAIEIRGDAEPHFKGGESINPRFPNFKPEFVRVRPHRIISWEVETEGFAPRTRTVN